MGTRHRVPTEYEIELNGQVLIVLEGMPELCGYQRNECCLAFLTPEELLLFARREFAEDHLGSNPAIRRYVTEGKIVFGLHGYPYQVGKALKFRPSVSPQYRDRDCFFILGACRQPSI